MRIKEGDVLRFKISQGVLLAGKEGVCRIEKFEKSRRGAVVYIEMRNDEGEFTPSARYWPFDVSFAPIEGGEFLPFR